MKLIAMHKASGMEKTFDNQTDMREYLEPIKDAWIWFFRYNNGFETTKYEFN